ncbi:homoserine O-succinyltransferase MetA [Bradyrhizobium canariense]|uniref:Homoserine O-succinyltransferase n=1 Tax=Bradyrhizobium canariense TaxID=255045 RepID=A0A1H1YH69_9BRAD|nr:homoserine O-succinyltransferase [Bradyrhizobium canariense]SDT20724.1 homoserine O-succinyltransferase [Bradyrhizobium canariense]
MTVLFDKHRPIISPALAPTQLREVDEFRNHQKEADAVLTIGLINNMPDSALQATERQFTRLLQAAAGNSHIHFHCFSLPSVKRSQQAKQLMHGRYRDIADLDRLHIDGLIVTGAEPNAAILPEEPFWQDLTGIIDWAEANTRSTIWSCLAAHAAVLHLDGIKRQRLDAKCSGVYDCFKVANDGLTKDITSPLRVAHSRLNALRKSDLTASGYQLLTESPEAGVDIFVKQLRSRFVFFQGHPEYDALSLQREYLRDITRYLARQRDKFPTVPANYFDTETERKLANYQKRAMAERQIPLSVELPKLTLRPDLAISAAASTIFRNWLEYLSEGVEPVAETTHPR